MMQFVRITTSIVRLSILLLGFQILQIQAIHENGQNDKVVSSLDTNSKRATSILSLHPSRGSELGGTELSLKGVGFYSENGSISCCFNETRVPANLISDEKIICYTPPSRPGKVYVSVCQDTSENEDANTNANESTRVFDKNVTKNIHTFEYTIMATIFSVTPSSGSGGNEIDIVGSGFLNSSDLCCRFHSILTPATFVTYDRIKCVSPIIDDVPSSTLLTVSNNGVDIEGDWASLIFEYTRPAVITSIDPITAPSSGGTSLFVHGDHYLMKNPLQTICKIDNIMVNATVLSTDEIVCKMPSFNFNRTKAVSVSISINGGYEFNIGVRPRILVHPPTKITAVIPESVPETGKAIISVFGEEFHRSPHLVCQFDGISVPAIWMSNSLLHCEAPPSQVGTVLLSVSTNGQTAGLSYGHVPFTFTEAVTLTSISPSSGPFTGGTTMYLYGTGFIPSATFLCSFGNMTVEAIQVFNTTTAKCIVPPLRLNFDNNISVDVSVNNGHDFTSSEQLFRYKPLYQIDSISPRLGPKTGNTKLRIYGNFTGFQPNESLCLFRHESFELTSSIIDESDEEITCLTPPVTLKDKNNSPIISLVELININDAGKLPLTERGASFTHYPQTSLVSLHPAIGTELGGTNVTIMGHFTRSNDIICKFDEQVSPYAEWISKDTIICTSPSASHNFLISPLVSVTILINGEDDEGLSLPFRYLIASHISAISPTFGSILGGTLVHVEGGGFPELSDIGAFCSFGGILTDAEILSESLAKCRSPTSRSSNISPFSITFNNGHEYITSSAEYNFVEQPIINEILPAYVMSSQMAEVRITGKNFPNLSRGAVWCSFGNFTLEAVVVNETLLTFTSPSVQQSIISRIKVSFNGVDFTPVGPLFSIFLPPVISRTSPNFSNEYGGIPISIQGSGFYNVSKLSCIFKFKESEYEIVHADYISHSSIVCKTPPMRHVFTKDVNLELSLTGVSSYDNPSSKISYYTGTVISSIHPLNCPKIGGSELSITGNGFTQQKGSYYCKIEELNNPPLFVSAKYHLDTALNCTVPASQNQNLSGASSARLSIVVKEDGQFFNTNSFSGSPIFFKYQDNILLNRVLPDTGSVVGGSFVNISGSNFMKSLSLCCSFSMEGQRLVESAIFFSSDLISCQIPELPSSIKRSMTVSLLQVSNNGLDFSIEGVRFNHRQQIVVETAEPTLFPEFGETNITVNGKYFFQDNDLSCIFSGGLMEQITQAVYLSPSLLRCSSPPLPPGLYSLSVRSFNIFSVSKVQVRAYSKISLHKTEPIAGPFCGGTKVFVSGQNFPNSTWLQCKFGQSLAKAIFISAEKIMCVAPRQYFNESKTVEIAVSGNAQDFTDGDHVRYLYERDSSTKFTAPTEDDFFVGTRSRIDHFQADTRVKLFQMTPLLGTVSGGQKVQLIGSDFRPHPNAACRFGVQIVGASILGPDVLECKTPKALNPGVVSVDISVNGVSWTDVGLIYNYILPFEIYDLQPTKFPTYGGTVVHVKGSNIEPNREIFCMFGIAGIIQAVVLSPNFLSCVSPISSKPGPFKFDIMMGETSILLNGPITLHFVKQVSFSVFPKFGPRKGNTPLQIRFDDSFDLEYEDLFCAFEFKNEKKYQMTLEQKNSSLYSCLTPNIVVDDEEDFVLSHVNLITMSGGFSIAKQGLLPSFSFKTTPTRIRITPSSGDISGGTKVTFIIESSSGLWLNSNSLTCKFGTIVVDGTWISKYEVECVSPLFKHEKDFRVPVSIAENGVDFIYAGQFHYLPLLSIVSLDTQHTFSNMRSEVHIIVSQLIVTDKPTCMFWSGSGKIFTHASVVTSTLLKCILPPYELGEEINVHVSGNGQEFSSASSKIKVIPIPRLVSVEPRSGISGDKTVVLLKGEHLVESLSWKCTISDGEFLLEKSASSISESLIQCEIRCPKVSLSTSYKLTLKTNEKIKTSSVPFLCSPRPNITGIFPSLVFARHKEMLTLKGDGFIPHQALKCIFFTSHGRMHTNASYIDRSTVTCLTPNFQSPQIVQFDISTDGNNFVERDLRIDVVRPVTISHVMPQALIAGGHIQIEGDFRTKVEAINCRIGGVMGRYIEYENDNLIKCHTPYDLPHHQYTSVDLLFMNTLISSPDTLISVTGRPSIRYISPTKALKYFSTKVTVIGKHFITHSSATCHFGKVQSRAYINSTSMLSCDTPPSREKAVVPFSVKFGSISPMNSKLFEYLDPWVLRDIAPSCGPTDGGTRVQIFGSNFDQSIDIQCLFGGIRSVAAEVTSKSTIQCISPFATHPHHVSISIVLASTGDVISMPSTREDGIEDVNGFYYYEDGVAMDLTPDEGVLSGGTEVVVQGTWFFNESYEHLISPKCSFGNREVTATLLVSGSISCISPPVLGLPVNMTLRVSLNGFDYIDGVLSYLYHENLVLQNLSPNSGPIGGGTRVALIGIRSLLNPTQIQCRFGLYPPMYAYFDIITERVICHTPSVNKASQLSLYLKVGSSRAWKNTGRMFKFEEKFIVKGVNPNKIGQDGELVHVVGEGFEADIQLYCKFGEQYTTKAYFSNPNMISCLAPSFFDTGIGSRFLSLSITSNHDDYFDAPYFLQYKSGITLSHIHPTMGPTTGGTLITIFGDGFEKSDELLCWFGGYATVANFISEFSVSCRSSALYLDKRFDTMKVTVSVTQNNFQRLKSSSSVDFYYYKNWLASDVELSPSSGPLKGGINVRMKGEVIDIILDSLKHVIKQTDLQVYYHKHVIEATIGTNYVQFRTPSKEMNDIVGFDNFNSNNIPIKLSINGGADILPSPAFEIYNNPMLIRAHPQVIISGYNTVVKVVGENFPSNQKVICRIGTVIFDGDLESNSIVACPLSKSLELEYNGKLTTLSVSFNEQDFVSDDIIPISIQSTPSISEVTPRFISRDGGTVVMVKGSSFKLLKNAGCSICLFRQVQFYLDCTSIELYDDSLLKFVAPSGFGSNIDIQFGCGKEYFNGTNIKLTYIPGIELNFLIKNQGNLKGGYVVSLNGYKLFPETHYSCVVKAARHEYSSVELESISVDATFVNETLLTCIMPSAQDIFGEMREGVAAIQVERHIDSSLSNKLLFDFIDIPSSPLLNQVMIPEFNNSSEASREYYSNENEFDGYSLQSTNGLNKTEAMRSLPIEKYTFTQTYSSADGENNIDLGQSLLYAQSIIVESIDNLMGSFHGGTIIQVAGKGFRKDKGIIDCMFGDRSISALILNDTAVECRSPSVYELFESLYLDSQESLNIPFSLFLRQQSSDYQSITNQPKNILDRILLPEQQHSLLNSSLFSLLNNEMLEKVSGPNITFLYTPDEKIDSLTPKSCPSTGDNNIIRIEGSGFLNFPQLSCKVGFAEPRKAIFINENIVDCVIPSAAEALGPTYHFGDHVKGYQKKTYVSVSNNGKDFDFVRYDITASFSYFEMPRYMDLMPRWGIAGLDIFLYSMVLPIVEAPSCRFGHNVVKARILHPSTLVCTAPELKLESPLKVKVDVSLNGFHFVPTGFEFEYINIPFAQKMDPLFGPDVGGSLVNIFGTNFNMNHTILCQFGDSLVHSTVLSNTELQCHTPPRQSGKVSFSLVAFNGENLVEELKDELDHYINPYMDLSFTYLDDFIVKELTPNFGPITGYTSVRVGGLNFHELTGLVCVFGKSVTMNASFVSDKEIKCFSPPQQIKGNETVALRLGILSEIGITFLSSPYAQLFTYIEVPYINKIYPSRGLLSGGDKIKVVGENFVQPLHNIVICAFGDKETNGNWVSSTEIECLTPSMPSSGALREIQHIVISEELTSTDENERVSFVLTFEDQRTNIISSQISEEELRIELMSLSTIGDIDVSHERNYNQDLNLREHSFDITFTTLGNPSNTGDISLLEVDLLSPMFGVKSEVSKSQHSCCEVQLSLNQVDYFGGVNLSKVAFTFDENIMVVNVTPTHGSIRGGTLVTLTGVGFVHANSHSRELHCIFGTEYVQAISVNSEQIKCLTPFFPSPAKVMVSIELYSDVEGLGTYIQSSAEFEFVLEPEIVNTFPEFFPIPRLFDWDLIDVYGNHFVQSEDLGCYVSYHENDDSIDNNILQSEFKADVIFHNSTYIQCVSSVEGNDIKHWKNSATLYVTTNGVDRTHGHDIDIVKSHSISEIFPASGPQSGGTKVLIRGRNFLDVQTLSCQFGSLPTVRGLYQSPEAIMCVVPSNHGDGNNTRSVDLTNNGYHFSSSQVLFHFHDDIEILSTEPTVGPSCGGTHVIIELGTGIDKEHAFDYVCKFNETHVPATQVENKTNLISCTSPPSYAHGGLVSFEVSINGFDFSSSGTQFLYLQGQTSESLILSPSHGPMAGGTLVKINGLLQMKNYDHWQLTEKVVACKFGDVIIPAVNVGQFKNYVICRSPNASLNGNATSVLVDISLTGAFEDFTAFGHIFRYDDLVTIAEVNPDTGPTIGGTSVQIRGGPFPRTFSSELLCRFGTSVVNATWKSKDEIGCVSPSLVNVTHNQVSNLAVSINGVDFSVNNGLFRYQLEVEINKLSPSHGYTGSTILVEGKNFFPDQQFRCHFDEPEISTISTKFHARSVLMATYLNETSIICVAPPVVATGYVTFFISIDGTEVGEDQGSLLFHYDEPISIFKVFPYAGPISGNFSVRVYGGPFTSPTHTYCCKFGNKIVNALFVSSNEITCISPPHVSGTYKLRITQNGQDFSEDFEKIYFYSPLKIDHIVPVSGPAQNAGSQVRLFGSNFINSTAARCKFHQTPTPAIYISEHEIECVTPALFSLKELNWEKLSDHRNGFQSVLFPGSHYYPLYSSKLVKVEVSMNAQDFTTLGHTFLYQGDIHVNRLITTEGPLWGGTPLFIHGSGFVNSTLLTCRFGHHINKGTFLTRNLILCFSPPQSHTYAESNVHHNRSAKHTFLVGPEDKPIENIFVEVSNNAIDFTDFRHVFKYTSTIPEGFYQPGVENSTILSCPRGSFCNGIFNSNFTLCPKGTYQSLQGQRECARCPIGFICPEIGLPVPRICPSGYVCDVTGIENAEQPCPAGFFCPAGTVTTETFCGRGSISNTLSASLTLAERSKTLRKGYIPLGHELVTGARNSICWDNSTEDYGLQVSILPGRFWDEIHTLPLDTKTPLIPLRGRYCQDDSCLNIQPSFDSSVKSAFVFNSSKVSPQRPIPCPPGTYCHPGSSTNNTGSDLYSSPQTCGGGNYCPEGSVSPLGADDCPLGYFCRFGKKTVCPVGTFCPFSNLWDPLPCEPGTFNHMIGQRKCTNCPLGHFCNGYGRVDPGLCPPGYACSKPGLSSPNIRCPAGFYCQYGTQTSDPFRNDTTLRPYPCSPGTYCVGGVGDLNVVEGNFSHAQPCPSGFFCESASTSAKGSGLCPPGFICPKGTATPQPTPKGHHAQLPGTVQAAACLPGFYAPTIESAECIPCPPGTSCEDEGLIIADICPPGSFRSTLERDGITCQTCPQGTWSKTWHLRDQGECTICPTGLYCPIDGMTMPCSRSDLPTPYEPVLNLNGIPVLEYKFSSTNAPPLFSIDECLQLNFAADKSFGILNDQQFFFGELIPPYIDILGRGAHIRITDTISSKYGSGARCYRNVRPKGSLVYERMATYYGPQYDIQTGFPHQGYGSAERQTPMFSIAPLQGTFDHKYQYFYGKGMMYIDLPRSPLFDPNLTLKHNDEEIVYTNENYDYEGGVDVERCSLFDSTLDCFIDPTFQLHEEGFCCNIQPWSQRAIFLAEDQYYSGTCEADMICAEEDPTEAVPCQDGFVCDEKSTSESSITTECPPGYVCSFGTTPDTLLDAPQGQFANMCPVGHFCIGGTGLEATEYQCPMGFFCPTGTSNPIHGVLADDSINRYIKIDSADPNKRLQNIAYFGEDQFQLLSDHDLTCLGGIDSSMKERYSLVPNKQFVENLMNDDYMISGGQEEWTTLRSSIKHQSKCARDNKWKLVENAIKRGNCDCNSQLFVLFAIYRLWQCTSISDEMEKVCLWPDSSSINLTSGKIPYEGERIGDGKNGRGFEPMPKTGLPFESGGILKLNNHGSFSDPDVKFMIQFNETNKRTFRNFRHLRKEVVEDHLRGNNAHNEFIDSLYHAIILVEKHGRTLEELAFYRRKEVDDDDGISLKVKFPKSLDTIEFVPGRLDLCECSNLLKCPNGTKTLSQGSSKDDDCIWDGYNKLGRISMIPTSRQNLTHVKNASDFTELANILENPIDTLELSPYEVAVFDLDLSTLPTNMTYGDHYQIAVYEDCKPCPPMYQCDRSDSCSLPSSEHQFNALNTCLKQYRHDVCVHKNGTSIDTKWCQEQAAMYAKGYYPSGHSNAKTDPNGYFVKVPIPLEEKEIFESSYLLYTEPDLYKCMSIPFFCTDKDWNYRTFRKLCQDVLTEDDTNGPIYDCTLVEKWNQYSNWKNNVCCSNSFEFGTLVACVNNTCSLDPAIDRIIREKFAKDFLLEHGYDFPTHEPKGTLLMDVSLQEDKLNPDPFSLFIEWDEFVEYNKTVLKPHNPFKIDKGNPWMTTKGCCGCESHPLPQFFEKKSKVSGYPDDKHRKIQLTISALKKVDLTIVVELLHGYFYKDFIYYFDSNVKKSLHIHRPSRFSSSPELSMWLSVLDKATIASIPVDLPLNLPMKIHRTTKSFENSILVDQPCDGHLVKTHSPLLPRIPSDETSLNFNETITFFDDDGRKIDYHVCLPEDSLLLSESSTWWYSEDAATTNDGNRGFSHIALPYLPFFSSCSGYDSHISLSRLVEEHPDCNLVPPESTQPVKQQPFSKEHTPISDMCMIERFDALGHKQESGISLYCQYEEQVAITSDQYRWFEAEPGTTLFHITSNAISNDIFEGKDLGSIIQRWGRSTDISGISKVPVRIDNTHGGTRNVIPRTVLLELQYYQIDKYSKRLVDATIYFVNPCTTLKPEYFGGDPDLLQKMEEQNIPPCETDFNGNIKSRDYEMQVLFYPLDWFRLLNRFQFDAPVYLGFYTLAGIISIGMGAFVWGITWMSTKLRHPPKFHGISLAKLIGIPSIFGCSLAGIVVIACMFIASFCSNLLKEGFEKIQGDWYTTALLDNATIMINQRGRSGLVLMVVGLYILFFGASLIIPSKPKKDLTKIDDDDFSTNASDQDNGSENEAWNPRLWKRANFLWYALCLQSMLMVFWEFSYSPAFEVNLHGLIILLKLVQMLMEVILMNALSEKLLCAPFMVLIGLTEILVSMGASDFVDFALIFFIQISLAVVHKIYLDPFVKTIQSLCPRWKFTLMQKVRNNKRKNLKQKQEEEKTRKKINEDIELRNEGVEPLIDVLTLNSIQIIGRYLSPFAFLLISIFYSPSEMAEKYGISKNELSYYALFALYMIPWSVVVDVLVLNSQELVHGWRLYDYLEYQRHRFSSREKRWTLDSPNFDESITEILQSIDSMSFSSQYYFLVTFLSCGMFVNMLGMTILLRSRNYNVLSDPAMPLIVAGVFLICKIFQLFIIRLGTMKIDYLDWRGVWGATQLEGTLDDIVAAKLAIGEGRQVDLERERMELEALNDEKFRQRFLDRNRPWVLQHLFEMFTGTGGESPPDRDMLLARARDLYSQLTNQKEGAKQTGDRPDISSDDESQENSYLNSWENLNFEGTTLRMIKMWLHLARRRQTFHRAIIDLIKSSVNSNCSSCSRDRSLCDSMNSYIARNGNRDPSVLDDLITRFEIEHSSRQSDIALWKSFFRQNAEIITLCNFCVNRGGKKIHENTYCKKIPARPGDISSDDDEDSDDCMLFSPVLVDKDSNHGHLISKWLDAARRKIGGHFPRPDAKRYAENYIALMKKQKTRGSLDVKTNQEQRRGLNDSKWENVKLENSSKLVMKKWLTTARQNTASSSSSSMRL